MNKEHSQQPTRYHRMKKLTIVGGFLDGAVFELDRNLNCVIGPRGSGKSTLLELIRFAFDLGPSEIYDPPGKKRFDSLIAKNLGGGRIELEVETKDGLTYTICRSPDEAPVILDAQGAPTNLDLRAGALFRPEIFSQNDVESIADRPSFQLGLIDSFCFEEIEEANGLIRRAIVEIDKNSTELLAISDQMEGLAEEVKTLPAVLEKLKGYAQVQGSKAEEVNKAHAQKSARDKELIATGEASNLIRQVGSGLREQLESFNLEAQSVYPAGVTDGPNAFLMDMHKSSFDAAAAGLDANIKKTLTDLREAFSELESLRGEIAKDHAKQDLDFRKLMEKVNTSNIQLKERLAWEKKKNQIELKQRELVALRGKRDTLESERQMLLDQLSELWDRRFEARHKVARKVTAALRGNVRVSVVQNGDRTAYRAFLVQHLAGTGMRHVTVADRIANEIPPSILVDLLKRKDAGTVAVMANINPEQAEKSVQALSQSQVRLELETIGLDDQPKIELKDGQQYKESGDLSTGQKCTTILPILMLESENPLLIDQPEDNLDNSFVYSDIVSSIKNVKNTRQLLFVTHNPNIPVLGDAERVFVLQSTGKKGSISRSGTVEVCRDDIIKLLEGGKEAFVKRKDSYGY